jgi:glutaredoxin 3
MGVRIYTLSGCGYCVRALGLLRAKGASVEEINVSGDPAAAAAVRQETGHRTFPQIFIGAEFVGGCSELEALDAAGRLDAMLA